jgi:hypothetical protein
MRRKWAVSWSKWKWPSKQHLILSSQKGNNFRLLFTLFLCFPQSFFNPSRHPTEHSWCSPLIDHAERKLLIKDLCSLKIRGTHSYCRNLFFRGSLQTNVALLFMCTQLLCPSQFLLWSEYLKNSFQIYLQYSLTYLNPLYFPHQYSLWNYNWVDAYALTFTAP